MTIDAFSVRQTIPIFFPNVNAIKESLGRYLSRKLLVTMLYFVQKIGTFDKDIRLRLHFLDVRCLC